jgi:pimeloyl-ACP methyl ester carboxylesterase
MLSPDQQMRNESARLDTLNPALAYMVDALQRQVLFWDTLLQRGNQYRERQAMSAPHVLNYAVELLLDGRTLKRPVNYGLVRVMPPAGIKIEPARRPFVIVDPRAGHGPGIGGFKADSEIGVAFKAGHPCYFIGFLPDPMPGQTIEDIARAEAVFLEKVIALHPEADGKPCVIGNCQAGWAIMMLAAMRPELFGPIIVAGSPLSYWAGVRGANPMRYTGGLLGGSWITALTSDLGAGKFDGAWLVENFENLNPANTFWKKHYNLYSEIDTESPRYLDFERWWGGHVNLNAEEIQFIVDELFIGNKLAAGSVNVSDGMSVDLRNIRSPIVVFCSKGDNITPPQQALGWILDLYDDVDEIRSYGQTIVYTIHESAGHLGIFVSSGVAKKEHAEFSSNIDLIDILPPGLYEARFERKSGHTVSVDLVAGDWVMHCDERTLDDIRALGGHEPKDEHLFAAVAQVSTANLAMYRSFIQPWLRAWATPALAEWMRKLHPLRLQYEALNDSSPFAPMLSSLAARIRKNRKPVDAENPFLKVQETVSHQIAAGLESWGNMRDCLLESNFLAVYGSPAVQAAAGVDSASTQPLRKAPKSTVHQALVQRRIEELKSRIKAGGLREATLRGLLYAGCSRGRVDERGIRALRKIRLAEGKPALTLAEFKVMAREQFYMLLLDPEATIEAIPSLLPKDIKQRKEAFSAMRDVLQASDAITGEAASRLQRIQELFGLSASTHAIEEKPMPPDAAAKSAKPKGKRAPAKSTPRISGNGRPRHDEHRGHRQSEGTAARKI